MDLNHFLKFNFYTTLHLHCLKKQNKLKFFINLYLLLYQCIKKLSNFVVNLHFHFFNKKLDCTQCEGEKYCLVPVINAMCPKI